MVNFFSMLDDGIVKLSIFKSSGNSNEFWIPIFIKFLQFHLLRVFAGILQELNELFLRGTRQTASLNQIPQKQGLIEENDNVSLRQEQINIVCRIEIKIYPTRF